MSPARTASKKTEAGKAGDGKPTLMLLDGNSLAYRAFYALPAENFKTQGGMTTNAVRMLRRARYPRSCMFTQTPVLG